MGTSTGDNSSFPSHHPGAMEPSMHSGPHSELNSGAVHQAKRQHPLLLLWPPSVHLQCSAVTCKAQQPWALTVNNDSQGPSAVDVSLTLSQPVKKALVLFQGHRASHRRKLLSSCVFCTSVGRLPGARCSSCQPMTGQNGGAS